MRSIPGTITDRAATPEWERRPITPAPVPTNPDEVFIGLSRFDGERLLDLLTLVEEDHPGALSPESRQVIAYVRYRVALSRR